MIELIQVNKTYADKDTAHFTLKDINLLVKTHEFCGIVGKSGAGKSTLIRCVNLLERPSSGHVIVDGQELTNLTPHQLREVRHGIGMIFQHFNLLSSRTVYENIALPLEITNHTKKEIEEAVTPLLELTGLVDKSSTYPAQLSGGQKQRVAIARALASKPKVLLCDEATSALDPHTTFSILQLLKNINQTLGLTILLITHEMDVIKQIADHVVILDKGEIVEQAPIINLFTHPQTLIAQDFVRSCLKQELPEVLQNQISTTQTKTAKNPVLRLLFHGKAASEPLIFNLSKNVGLEINILQANIEFIKGFMIGIMVIEVINNHEKLSEGLTYLQSKGLNVEVIGYVASAIHGIA